MSSPVRSVVVRLAMDPSSYVAGAAKAEKSTLSLDAATSKVGPHAATSMEQAAAGAGKAEGALGKLNKSAGALGVTLGGLAGVGGAVAVGMSVKWAADYQQALTKLVTTAGESPKALASVSKGMLDMAGQVGISAQELAQGMYIVDSANIHGADSLTVLKAAAQGAKQENADLGHVVDAVTTALHDYNLPASDAAKVTSQLITAVSHGKTSFDALTGAMHSVTPLAAALHVPLSDIAGTLSAMTASGESADQAAQNMADALRHMQNPTSTMTAELAQLGITSTDLGPMLGQKGLAGTIQTISAAIVNHLDPATKQVLLPALNKSKVATADLAQMMATMPPALAKASKALLTGSTSITDYQKSAKGMSGTNGAMALQFLSLYKNSQGFNNILKSGQPAAQTYTAALQKAMGTSAGLTVALQVTGEHAAATNAAIVDIAHATGDTAGNIKGWAEVQSTFNQQLAQTEQGMRSLAIEAGQHLLPVLTGGLTWINQNGPGILHGLGTGLHDVESAMQPLVSVGHGAVDVFKALPGPMQETVLALAALRAASALGWLDGLSTGAGKARAALTSMSSEIGAAFTAAKANQVRMVGESAALWDQAAGQAEHFAATNTALWSSAATAVEGVGAASGRSVGNLAGLGAAAKTAATQGLGLMKSAGSGLVSLLGGPWGVAIAGASLGIAGLTAMVEHHNAQIQADTNSVTAWQKAIQFGGTGAADAAKHLDDLRQKIADNQKAIDAYNAAAAGGNARGGIGALVSQQKDLKSELDKGTKAWKDQLAGMTPVEEGTQRVTLAQHDLAMALKSGNPDNIRQAYNELAAAQTYLTGETNKENTAQLTQNQLLEKAAADALSSRDAAVGLHLAQLNLSDSITRVSQGMKDGTLKGNALAEAQLQLAQEAKGVAEQAGAAAAAVAKQNGETDTGTTSNLAMLASLRDTAKHLSGPALTAVNGYIADLQKTTSAAGYTADKVSHLGATVAGLPNGHLIVIDAPTAKQEADLHRLGYVTATLPSGHVVVTADTNPAEKEIQDLLAYARAQAIQIRAALPPLNAGTSHRMGTYDGGGYTGPGGKYEVAGIVHKGEVVWSQEDVDAHGGPAAVDARRRSRIPGYANGGVVGSAPLRGNIGLAASNVGYSLTGYLGSSFVPALTGTATSVVAGINSVSAKALAAEKSGAAARLAAAEAANARATAAAKHRSSAHRAAVARANAERLAAVKAYNVQALNASTAFSKSLTAAEKPLADMANRRQAVADQLKDAQAKLVDAIKVRDDFAAQVQQSAQQYADLTQVQATRGLPLSSNAIVADLQKRLAAITQFRENLAVLAKEGLSTTEYDQLVAAGVSGGSATATALVAGGQAAVDQVNAVQSSIDTASKDLGAEAAKTMYQAGVDTAQGLVNGLSAQSDALTTAAKHLADLLTSEVKKALGIHSPSRVFHEIGGHIGQGMVNGIAGMRPAVAKEMRALADTQALAGLTTTAVAAPVRTREMSGAGGGGAAAGIDYRQLAAAVAAAIPDRPTVHVDRWDSTAGQTPYENAEALAFISRTRTN